MGILDPIISARQSRDVQRRNLGPDQLFAVATESAHTDGAPYSGPNTYIQTLWRHKIVVSCASIRLVYTNIVQRDTIPTNNLSVRAGLEVTGITGGVQRILPVYFNGNRDVTIVPGGYAISDPIPISLFPGATVWSRTACQVSANTGWPTFIRPSNSTWGEGTETGTTWTDKTTSGTITAASNQAGYGPVMIAGVPRDRTPFVGISGDSIAAGYGEVNGSTAPDAGWGFLRRALGGTIPHAGIAATGATASESTFWREFAIQRCTDVVDNIGINDFNSGTTLAQFQPLVISRWRRIAGSGAKVWHTTITPKTTSTDSWATVANQTASMGAGETARVSFNNWLRDGAPITLSTMAAAATGASGGGIVRAGAAGHPLAGYFEVADTVETARDSGLWKAGYTSDGLHPNGTGHPAAAAAITTSKFSTGA